MQKSPDLYLKNGLTDQEVLTSLQKYGYNEIPGKKSFNILKILLSQFASFLIIILIISGAVSILLGELLDGIAIFAIVAINATIGFLQEYKAENAIKALKKMVVPETIVIRNDQEQKIPIRELAVGDIVLLYEGDKIPADLEIIEAFSLKVDESILTGESMSVNKTTGKKTQESRLFKGTLIVSGRAKAKTISTGMSTEFGKIVTLVQKQEDSRSPLTLQLDNLSKKTGLVILVIITILFILGRIRGASVINMLMASVSLGVAAIPEGMPIIVTLTLALGVQLLAKKNAIIHKMNAIESLGATTVICSDKTGTLTLNEMTVKKMFANFKEKEIPGAGYKTSEKIKINSPEEKKLLEIAYNCNNSFLGSNTLGDPTEIALKVLAKKGALDNEYEKIDEMVFTSERKMMSSLHDVKGKKEIFTKGAFEEIIKTCSHILKNGKIVALTAKDKKALSDITDEYSKEAMRTLAFAYKPFKNNFSEENLIFVGIAGMIDPPRKTVKDSIALAKQAHIKIKIITGDNAETAKAIGKKIGLRYDRAVTGDEIDKMSDQELLKALQEVEIFARTKPQHKFRIVDILKKANETVAVTGDGVNDAPALKHADVGIAMGIKGTEATKEVADIVLKDDNFSTIVNTISEGRKIYQNILAFVRYMLSTNFGELAFIGTFSLLGYPMAILPLQLLWVNVATDALPALALGRSPASPNIMSEYPHPKNESMLKKFSKFMSIAILFQLAFLTIIFFVGLKIDTEGSIDLMNLKEPSSARTMIFTAIVIFEIFFAFVCKEEKPVTLTSLKNNPSLIYAGLISLIMQITIIYVPAMQNIFKTTPLAFEQWLLIIALCSSSFLIPYVNIAINSHIKSTN
ncbi:MAG: cation-translocating P-type ATPase [Candidatus Gracilibacteria bacterium]|jgi:Ca2+-transporting ATPase